MRLLLLAKRQGCGHYSGTWGNAYDDAHHGQFGPHDRGLDFHCLLIGLQEFVDGVCTHQGLNGCHNSLCKGVCGGWSGEEIQASGRKAPRAELIIGAGLGTNAGKGEEILAESVIDGNDV